MANVSSGTCEVEQHAFLRGTAADSTAAGLIVRAASGGQVNTGTNVSCVLAPEARVAAERAIAINTELSGI